MQKIIQLRLYGEIDHSGEENRLAWQLFQSEALTRLRDISLSSTPSRFTPFGMAASRFEHSVGVGYLARKLCDWRSGLAEHRDLLVAAALCHDTGSPPFSHISELFFWDQSGRTHEQETERLLAEGSELAEIISAHGVDPARVVALITGRDESLGPLIAGTIDLDNVDNSLHLLLSLGFNDPQPYEPLDLLRAFRFREGRASLDAEYLPEIIGWQRARATLYEMLHLEPMLSASSMLYRALEYAYGKGRLEPEFFASTESEALYHLRHNCGRNAGRLIDAALRWKHYPMLYQSLSAVEEPRLCALYDDWKARRRFTDRLAERLGIPAVELCLYIGRDRGERAIDLPFVGRDSEAVAELFRRRPGQQRLAIFADSSHRRLRESKKVERAVCAAIDELPEAPEQPRHVFF